jgi:hypothetical protein
MILVARLSAPAAHGVAAETSTAPASAEGNCVSVKSAAAAKAASVTREGDRSGTTAERVEAATTRGQPVDWN